MPTLRGMRKRLLRATSAARPFHWVSVGDEGKILVDLRDEGGLNLAVWGSERAQPLALRMWRLLLTRYEWDLIIDIGANYGEFVVIANSLMPTAAVLAVEPIPEVCTALRRTTSERQDVEIVCAAAGAETGVSTLNTGSNSRLSSLEPSDDHDSTMTVATISVDDLMLLEPYANKRRGRVLLKIDAEGAEPAILRGAETLLAEAEVAAVLTEAIHSDLLKSANFPDDFTVMGIARNTGELASLPMAGANATVSTRDVVLIRNLQIGPL